MCIYICCLLHRYPCLHAPVFIRTELFIMHAYGDLILRLCVVCQCISVNINVLGTYTETKKKGKRLNCPLYSLPLPILPIHIQINMAVLPSPRHWIAPCRR